MNQRRLRGATWTRGTLDHLIQAARTAAQAAEDATAEEAKTPRQTTARLQKLLNAAQEITRQINDKRRKHR